MFIVGKGTSQINFDLSSTVTAPFLEGAAGANAELGINKFGVIAGVTYDVQEYIPNLWSYLANRGSTRPRRLNSPVYQIGLRLYNTPYFGSDQVFVECKYKFAKDVDESSIRNIYFNVGFKYITKSRFITESYIGVSPTLSIVSDSSYNSYPGFFGFQFGFRVGYRLIGSNTYANTKTTKKKSKRSKKSSNSRTPF